MIKKQTMTEKKSNFNKKAYFAMKNKQVINIRLNPEERSRLEIDMQAEGWKRVSTYIKHRLGLLGGKESIVKEIVATKSPDVIGILLKNELIHVAEQFRFFNISYSEATSGFADETEEKVIQMIQGTQKMHSKTIGLFREMMLVCNSIVKGIGIKKSPSKFLEIDLRATVKSELDALAKRSFLEDLSKGEIIGSDFSWIQEMVITGRVLAILGQEKQNEKESFFKFLVTSKVEDVFAHYLCFYAKGPMLNEGDYVYVSGAPRLCISDTVPISIFVNKLIVIHHEK